VSWMLNGEEVIDPSGRSTPLDLALPGRANKANAVVALAVAESFGVHLVHRAARGSAPVTSVGRPVHAGETGAACEIRLLLAKNPAGWAGGARRSSPPPPAPGAASRSTRRGPTGRGHVVAVGR